MNTTGYAGSSKKLIAIKVILKTSYDKIEKVSPTAQKSKEAVHDGREQFITYKMGM